LCHQDLGQSERLDGRHFQLGNTWQHRVETSDSGASRKNRIFSIKRRDMLLIPAVRLLFNYPLDSPSFMEAEASLPFSKQPVAGPYSEPHKNLTPHFFKIHFNAIPTSASRFCKRFFPKKKYAFHFSSLRSSQRTRPSPHFLGVLNTHNSRSNTVSQASPDSHAHYYIYLPSYM
jgi:hypothetical protein